MRILMLEPNFIPTSPAGSQMLLLANRLADKHEVTVVAAKLAPTLEKKVEWIHLSKSPKSGFSLRDLYLYDNAIRILAAKGRIFDIVHTVDPKITIPSALKYGRYIATLHFCVMRALEIMQNGGMCYLGPNLYLRIWYNMLNSLRYETWGLLERRLIHTPSDQIWVAVSKGLAEELRHFYRPQDTIEVIPNAILHQRYQDLEHLRSTTRTRLAIRDDSLVAIAIAQGHWGRKGLFVLLEAIQKVPESVVLLIVGGSRLNHLRWEVQRLGINDRVRFAGFVDDPRPYYAAADLFVLPSYYEAFPLVYLEAAAAGLPILSTSVNGVSEWMVDGKTGFFISHDPADIAYRIQLLAENPTLRLSLGNGARQAISPYTVEAMVTAYESLYERVLEGLA